MAHKEVIAERITLIGVGLIGGSLARDLRRAGAVKEVVATARTEETLRTALELGVIDRAESDVEAAVRDSEIVVIATPMQAMPKVLTMLDGHIGDETTVTDVGSVKAYVVEAVNKCLPNSVDRFVPGHPIAGTENSGVAASQLDLFKGRTVILTPSDATSPDAVDLISRMWQLTGAETYSLDARTHDDLLAATSHLPHVVAYALVEYLAEHEESDTLFKLAAAGFYDFTRIASSDPVMWRDICLTNRDGVLKALMGYRTHIDKMLNAIRESNGEVLLQSFDRSKRSRDNALKRSRQRKS